MNEDTPRTTAARATVGLGLLAVLFTLPAQAQVDAIPQVLLNVRVVVAPGRTLEQATILIEDGVLRAVGADVTAPAGARVRDGEGLTVYPGLIEPYSPRDWPEAPSTEGDDEESEVGHENPVVGPERDVLDAEYDGALAKRLRAAGFTTAVAVPEDGIFRGRAAIFSLGDGGARSNLLRPDAAQVVAFSMRGDGGYPVSKMGSVALFRQVANDAQWYHQAQALYAETPSQRRPEVNRSLATLEGVMGGDELVLFASDHPLDVLRWGDAATDLGLRSIVVGTGSEYQWAEKLAATGLAMILPVDFPSEPSVADEDDLSVSLAALRHWDQAPSNPQRLAELGVEIALTSKDLPAPKDIHGKLAAAIERGLSPDAALAALTTVPAKWLGLGDVAGTVEAGKMANLVLVEGDLFVENPKIREVWVEGHGFELQEVEPPQVNPVGTWDIDLDAGGMQIQVGMTISGEVDDLSGAMTVMGNTISFDGGYVSGKTVIITLDATSIGAAGELVFRMNIEGDRGSGSGDSPMGAFTFQARRTSSTPERSVR